MLGCWEGLAEVCHPPARTVDLFAWQETINALNFFFLLPALRDIYKKWFWFVVFFHFGFSEVNARSLCSPPMDIILA